MTTASPTPPQRTFSKGLFGWALFIVLALMLVGLLRERQNHHPTINLGTFHAQLQRGNVAWLDIAKDAVTGELENPITLNNQSITRFDCPLPEGTTSNWAFTQWVLENATTTRVGVDRSDNNLLANVLVPIIPWLLIFAFIYIFVFRQLKNAQRGTTTPPLRVTVVGHEPIATTPPAAPAP